MLKTIKGLKRKGVVGINSLIVLPSGGGNFS
jgi:hypothetical protein